MNGRSMVEMLGVLAIVGILSAGAMAGYSKAMFRHRVNQTLDVFNGVLQRFQELEQKDLKNDFSIDGPDDIIKYGILSSCQKQSGTNYESCKLPVGNLTSWMSHNGSYVHGEFVIDFSDSKSCVAFLSAHLENAIPVDWLRPLGGIFVQSENIYAPGYNDNELTMSEITDYCSFCDEDDTCSIWFVIRENA